MSEERVKLGKDMLLISIMTLLTVSTWILLEVYHLAQQNTIPAVTQQQMRPLSPNLKSGALETIGQRFSPDENQIREAVSANAGGAITEPETGPSQETTESASLEE